MRPFTPDELIQEVRNPPPNPYRDAPASIAGKMVARHANGTIDVSLNSGGVLRNVMVCSPVLSTDSGDFYIPKNDLATQALGAQGPYEPPTPAQGSNVYCLVEFATNPFSKSPNSRMPFVRTFLPPDNIQFIGEVGLSYSGHESGIYETIDAGGNKQTNFPDGSWLSVGPTTTQKDMSAVNDNWEQPTGGSPINLIFHHSSGAVLEVSSTGVVSVTGASKIELNGSTAAVSRVGDSVSVNTSTGIGTITSGSTTVFAG